MTIPSDWIDSAMRRINADFNRTADTHLLRLDIPGVPGIPLYLKDESIHPSGSLKHRLARSLFLYAICNGWIGPETTIVEASSGNTAVSEAYFARLLDLPFVAVIPKSTSQRKIAQIEFYGGRVHCVDDPLSIYEESQRLADSCGGHFMDQFTYAERVTDWRGNNNIAEAIFEQTAAEEHPVPAWIVCSAGTGGTSATIGRYTRYRGHDTQLCVADPEISVFHDHYHHRRLATAGRGSRVEGIGRPRVEPSFIATVIDEMIKVPDAGSFAALRYLEEVLGRKCGGSTGTNLYAAVQIMARMREAGETGSVVTLICDPGERYLDTYFDDGWLRANGFDIDPHLEALNHFHETGEWSASQ